jgi:c-di-GMP-binding flagellar brake protein YcgR
LIFSPRGKIPNPLIPENSSLKGVQRRSERRIFAIQKKEIAGKMSVPDFHRFYHFHLYEVFYRAIFSEFLTHSPE